MVDLAKLDSYEYMILPGVVRIEISSITDPTLVDVMSEIENSKDLIFVDDTYYAYLGEYEIAHEFNDDKVHYYLHLKVVEIMPERVEDILNTRR